MKEKKIIALKILVNDPIFQSLSHIRVFEAHRWVVSKIGNSVVALAESSDGIEVIRHISKPIYGVQFHPELFPDQTQGDEIFSNILAHFEQLC